MQLFQSECLPTLLISPSIHNFFWVWYNAENGLCEIFPCDYMFICLSSPTLPLLEWLYVSSPPLTPEAHIPKCQNMLLELFVHDVWETVMLKLFWAHVFYQIPILEQTWLLSSMRQEKNMLLLFLTTTLVYNAIIINTMIS